jgi:hypothetical protein
MTKKYLDVAERVGDISVDGKIEDVISTLQSYIDEYGNTAYIKEEYAGYDGGIDLVLYYTRKETDREREKRLALARAERAKNKKWRKQKEEKELKLLEQLKAKYEG